MTNIEFISNIAKDILGCIKHQEKISYQIAIGRFYKIMRKYNIKQGTYNQSGGRTCNNFEWTMCKTLFMDTLNRYYEWLGLFEDDLPKDLLAYGKAPKLKK